MRIIRGVPSTGREFWASDFQALASQLGVTLEWNDNGELEVIFDGSVDDAVAAAVARKLRSTSLPEEQARAVLAAGPPELTLEALAAQVAAIRTILGEGEQT